MNRNVSYRDIVKSYDRTGQMQVDAATQMALQNIINGGGSLAALAGQACGTTECCPVQAGNNARAMPAGFDEFCLDSCEVELAETLICAPTTLTGVYVSPTVACHLSVRNLVVCRWQGFGNSNWIPADFFACCDATAAFEMWSVTVPANSKIVMEVRNDSKKDNVKFKGAVITVICDPC